MKAINIIGLTGKAGAGKDSVADYLVAAHGFIKLSFASPIKAGLNAMFGWTDEDWANRAWKERVQPLLGKSPRQLAQTLGTEWGRQTVYNDIWVDATLTAAPRFKRVVIADVRFDNEAEAILAQTGSAVFDVQRHTAPEVAAHSSEGGVSFNLITDAIMNTSDFDSLYAQIDSTIYSLQSGIYGR
jgi:hypothetical protein